MNFEYKIISDIKNLLNKLSFKCVFNNEGCNNILSYSEYINHINNCKCNKTKLKCCINKYNYEKKEFEKCGYIGNEIEIIKHFKSCEFIKYKCIFCNENILQMNLKEHVENKCKLGIFNYPSGYIYIGQKQ